jgi:anti-sigma B factor antagonist
MGDFSISDHDDGMVAFVVVGGEIDYQVSPALGEFIDRQGRLYLVLDLSAVTFIDSTAIAVIRRAYWNLDKAGGRLALVLDDEGDDPVFGVLQLTGMVELIPVFRTCEDAAEGVRSALVP